MPSITSAAVDARARAVRHVPVLESGIFTQEPGFLANVAWTEGALAELHKQLGKARDGGGAQANQRHQERGRLLPRDRVAHVLDRGAPFLELCPLAGLDVDNNRPGAGLIGGVGVVAGVECVISANDATVQGGAITAVAVQKTRRLAEISAENRLPFVMMVESAGADLPNQADIFLPGGRGFRDITTRSKEQVPTVCLVFGSSTAGGAYMPGMSDYVVMVKQQAQAYLAGPPLVKMAIGEDVDDEALGGADMHARTSGLCDYLAEDELDACRLAREIIASIGWEKAGPGPSMPADPPRYDPTELRGLAVADLRQPIPAREVIARIVDGSRFQDFKPLYGPTLVTGFASICGFPVGILANDGILWPESAEKGAQFIQLCNQRNIPLIFLHNTTGFMVGEAVERRGIIRAGAKLVNAVSNSAVPAITLQIGASYGAGNYAMCGRAYGPRFLFTWPNHRIAVMGGEQLAGVLDIIKRQSAARKGRAVDEEELGMMKQLIAGKIDHESSALYATARIWDDGVIDPADSRTVLALALSAVHSAPVVGSMAMGVFRH
ncbi:MAG: acyl-CoA carboxylase subunit beta [Deltaproteobacteria bacterium]|nr:acyl-CoA carboxylase subunit beta [Deltaproteobacteria bacterium]